jgi:hypothetical protein
MNLFRPSSRRQVPLSDSATRTTNHKRLTRNFIETGDERCPLAGIWSCLTEDDALVEDPELIWPATWMLLPWRALYFSATQLRYSIP